MAVTPDREEALRLARLDVEQEYGSPASRRNARLALALAADLEAAERRIEELETIQGEIQDVAEGLRCRAEAAERERDDMASATASHWSEFEQRLQRAEKAERERDEAIHGQANIEFRRLQDEIRRLREGWDGWQKQALAAPVRCFPSGTICRVEVAPECADSVEQPQGVDGVVIVHRYACHAHEQVRASRRHVRVLRFLEQRCGPLERRSRQLDVADRKSREAKLGKSRRKLIAEQSSTAIACCRLREQPHRARKVAVQASCRTEIAQG